MKLPVPGNNALLEIDVLAYAYPNATDFYDLNWLRCKILCRISSLTVKEEVFLQTADFVSLKQSIVAFNTHTSNIIEFKTLEEQLHFSIEQTPKCVIIKGTIFATPPTCGIFTFEFKAEVLPFSTIESLEKIILNFPVIS